MKCSCGDEAPLWFNENGINIPKCSDCYIELTYGKVPKLELGGNFGGRLGLTPRQAAKLNKASH